jgi:glucose/arabinose dehydrogenase
MPNSTRIVSVLALVAAAGAARAEEDLDLSRITLPDGFAIEIFAADVPNARSLTIGGGGTVFVGTRTEGNVYAIPTKAANGARRAAGPAVTIASELNMPNGVAWRDGSLYVAEVNRILRYDGLEASLEKPPEPVVVSKDFPGVRHHGWKYIAFGPDDKLYVPVGAPCNICDQPGFAEITRMNPDGSGKEVFARGVRNTVGFTWHPESEEMWFTDNGRDWMGDDTPPCELNHAPEAGLHFGYPHCHGAGVSDPDFARGRECSEFTPPVQELGPHVAPLGLKFYTGDSFPAEYRGQVFIAEHGSWNRTDPIGYRITRVPLEGDRATGYETFAEGWLQDGKSWGRPVDLLVLDDGAMLVSDDQAGVIYRIYYEGRG